MRKSVKGIALATILIFIPILLVMLLALFASVQSELFTSQNEYNRTQALYLAEAGVADVMRELKLDPTWKTGFTNRSLPGINGVYSVSFQNNPAGPFTSVDSINNDNGTRPNSHRGNNSVPTGHVLLIVQARVGPVQRQLEVLLGPGTSVASLKAPLLSSGKIKLQDQVLVDGIKSLTDTTPVAADIHSNMAAGAGLITWTQTDLTTTATVSGKVSTVSSDAGAISMPGATISGGTQTNASAQGIPAVDIVGTITSKSGATQPGIPGSGGLTLTAGDWYLPGNAVINGDLVLDGAQLHVNGSLTVNGSITGAGSTYVAGETHFQGDAKITAGLPDNTAVYSNGSIFLEGFDGSEYLAALGSTKPAVATTMSNIQTSMADMSTYMSSPVAGYFGSGNLLEQVRGELGAGATPRPGNSPNQLAAMVTLLNAEPPSPTRDFMIARFSYLNDVIFYNFGSGELAALDNDQFVAGVYDEIFDGTLGVAVPYLPKLVAYVDNIDYNRIGASQFQGVVYTHGFIYADNEVTINGAAVAQDDGSQAPQTYNGQNLDPGDIFMGDGCRLTYVEDFFDDAGGGGGAAGWQVLVWMGR